MVQLMSARVAFPGEKPREPLCSGRHRTGKCYSGVTPGTMFFVYQEERIY